MGLKLEYRDGWELTAPEQGRGLWTEIPKWKRQESGWVSPSRLSRICSNGAQGQSLVHEGTRRGGLKLGPGGEGTRRGGRKLGPGRSLSRPICFILQGGNCSRVSSSDSRPTVLHCMTCDSPDKATHVILLKFSTL